LSHYPVVNILAIHFLIHYFSKKAKIELLSFSYYFILFYDTVINFEEVELVEQGKASTQSFN